MDDSGIGSQQPIHVPTAQIEQRVVGQHQQLGSGIYPCQHVKIQDEGLLDRAVIAALWLAGSRIELIRLDLDHDLAIWRNTIEFMTFLNSGSRFTYNQILLYSPKLCLLSSCCFLKRLGSLKPPDDAFPLDFGPLEIDQKRKGPA